MPTTCLAETTGCPLWECPCPECVRLEAELNDTLGIAGPPQNACQCAAGGATLRGMKASGATAWCPVHGWAA